MRLGGSIGGICDGIDVINKFDKNRLSIFQKGAEFHMKLVTPQIIIDEAVAFKGDILGRKDFGEALSNIIINCDEKLVISLDGKWGEGKTTFVKMWQVLLKEKHIASIYIDAFQHDYCNDAFVTIASAITKYSDLNSSDLKKKLDLKNNAKKVGAKLLGWGAKAAIKALTIGAVGAAEIESLSEIGDDIAKDASEACEKFLESRFSEHSNEVEAFDAFRKTLSELPAVLNNNLNRVDGSKVNRLVIIIDELDRCKPSFAVEVIEKIKHLFLVENIVFLLVINKEQMEGAIKYIYGESIDAHTYLQKFINVETSIPQRLILSPNEIDPYSKKLLTAHELNTTSDDTLLLCIAALARHFNLSLRQLEKVYTNIAIIYGALNKNEGRVVPIIAFIGVLKVVKPHLYETLSKLKLGFNILSIEIDGELLKESFAGEQILAWLMYTMLTDEEFGKLEEQDPARSVGRNFLPSGFGRKNVIKYYCSKLNMFAVN